MRYVYASPEFGHVIHSPEGAVLARFDIKGPVLTSGRWGTDDPIEAAAVETVAAEHGVERVSPEDPTTAAAEVTKAREANDAAAAEAARQNAAANPGATEEPDAQAPTPTGEVAKPTEAAGSDAPANPGATDAPKQRGGRTQPPAPPNEVESPNPAGPQPGG